PSPVPRIEGGKITTSSATCVPPTSLVAVPMKLPFSILLRLDFSTFRYVVLPVRATVTGLWASVLTVTESAVADAMVPRTRAGIPVAASAADEARAAAAIARPRIRFGLMSSPSENVVHGLGHPP